MPAPPLRCLSFLAPNMFGVYEHVVRRLGAVLGRPAELSAGTSYDELDGGVDLAFVCGLVYVELARRPEPAFEPLAAPVLRGPRYAGRPVYFSDVIVRRDSPIRSFADLRGRSWSYNELHSHSGYGVTRFHLARCGETNGFFGKVVEAGWHERSIRLVCAGEVDASAIDSHVLAVALRDEPELADHLRVIDSLGPSTVQPLVASSRLPVEDRAALRGALLEIHEEDETRGHLARGFIERFVAVDDASYDDIRRMWEAAEEAGVEMTKS